MSYRDEYIKFMASDKWATRKRVYYSGHEKKCKACGSDENIHLHHKTYERMGSELDEDLVPLCQTCHTKVHDLHRGSKHDLESATAWIIASVSGELAGKLEASRKRQAARLAARKRLKANRRCTKSRRIIAPAPTTRLKKSLEEQKCNPRPRPGKAGKSDPVNTALARRRVAVEYQVVGEAVWFRQTGGDRFSVSADDFQALRKSLRNRDWVRVDHLFAEQVVIDSATPSPLPVVNG